MVYNDLNESNYTYKYKRYTFYFSSEFYLEKFKSEIDDYIKIETNKLKVKFRSEIIAEEFLAICLYKKIEKRGFKILYNDDEIKSEITGTIVTVVNKK